ncbi:hypothetical protein PtA15_10A726 [Puccinia triticina]|uniref:Cep57 centrosome microtubule-binding domain-containing protein n=1 Tax=Puccinia triticina TaxID=208348 RepID=A0ABY7CXY3_9BASI|nr:uncharacterized protein PtA15_10A726 [Puccinia triticina]WAQ89302.1 hypothetical protein PtA15_10A726 [Puccinia triticina]
MIDSLSSAANDSRLNPRPSLTNLTLNQARNDAEHSLDEDLRAFEQEQRNLHRRPIISRASRVSDDLTEDGDEFELDDDGQNSHRSAQTTTIDDEEHFDQEESDSFRIGLSSLSPPGIGRASHHPGQLSTVTLDPEDDYTYQGAQDFSRDLSALSLSPIRRPSAPTPQRASSLANLQDFTMDDERSEGSQTPASGFQGMARQLRQDFQQLARAPSPGHPKTKNTKVMRKEPARGGTLKGGLPANDSIRAKHVFGSEPPEHALKPPRFNQLHSAGLTSTPPVKSHPFNPTQQDHQNQHRARSTLAELQNHNPPRPPPNRIHKPIIRVVDASSNSNTPHGHDTSLAPGARKIVGNSVRVPDVTGLTDALCSPEKADFPSANTRTGMRPSSQSARPDPTLNEALTLLRRQLGSLEAENRACHTRIHDLQSQLGRAKQPPASTAAPPPRAQHDYSMIATDKPAVERMVKKLKANARRIAGVMEAHAIALDELTSFKERHKTVRQELRGVKSDVEEWSDQVEDMKGRLAGLTSEVRELCGMVERLTVAAQAGPASKIQVPGPSQPGMSRRGTTTTKSSEPKASIPKSQPAVKRHQPTTSSHQPTQSHAARNEIEDWRSQTSTIQISGQSFIGADEIENLKRDVEQEQLLRRSAQGLAKPRLNPTPANPITSGSRPAPQAKPTASSSSRAPPIRTSSAPTMKFGGSAEQPVRATDEVSRGEAILNSLPKGRHDDMSCSQCRLRRQKSGGVSHPLSSRTSSAPVVPMPSKKQDERTEVDDEEASLPPQAVLVGILKDLEEDFEVHRKIFVELSETYRKMNPAAIQVSKRKALAQHLRESVDTLEKKAGHIKHLYDLLHVKDLPLKSGSSKKV